MPVPKGAKGVRVRHLLLMELRLRDAIDRARNTNPKRRVRLWSWFTKVRHELHELYPLTKRY